MLYAFLNSLMRATCPAHLSLLDSITLIIVYLVTSTNYEVPHYAVFPSLLLLHPLRFKHFPQLPVLKHPLPSM
jgi:hypothetical protein